MKKFLQRIRSELQILYASFAIESRQIEQLEIQQQKRISNEQKHSDLKSKLNKVRRI